MRRVTGACPLVTVAPSPGAARRAGARFAWPSIGPHVSLSVHTQLPAARFFPFWSFTRFCVPNGFPPASGCVQRSDDCPLGATTRTFACRTLYNFCYRASSSTSCSAKEEVPSTTAGSKKGPDERGAQRRPSSPFFVGCEVHQKDSRHRQE